MWVWSVLACGSGLGPPAFTSDPPPPVTTGTPPDLTPTNTVPTLPTDDTDPPVTTDPTTDPPTDPPTTTGTPPPPTGTGPWSHGWAIDGDDVDWFPEEEQAIVDGALALTWDSTDLYIGVRHPDVAEGGSQHWFLLAMSDGTPGSTVLPSIGTQQATLPFAPDRLLRWKADDTYDALDTWDGTAWATSDNWLETQGSLHQEHNERSIVEFRLPRDAFESTTLEFAAWWVFEGAGFETSYAVSPTTAFAHGIYDPDLASWWRVDLTGTLPFGDIQPQP